VVRIAYVVHESQSESGGRSPEDVILHNQPAAGHTKRFTQQHQRIMCVMENVDQHNPIEAGLRVRKIPSVERLYGQPDPLANQDIDALNPKIRTLVEQRSRQFSVAATNIQDTAGGRDQFGEKLRKTADAPAIDMGRVDLAEHTHLRANPRMLKKKLARMVSTPSVIDTIDAATKRTSTTGFMGPNPARFHRKRE